MYQHLGELIEFTILIAIGIGLIIQWKKNKKEILLWGGIILITINFVRGGIAFNDFLNARSDETLKQEQKLIDRQKLQETLKTEITSKIPLTNDTAFTFDNTMQIFVPKNFTITEHSSGDVQNLILSLLIDKGEYMVTVSKALNNENLTFNQFTEQMDNYFSRSNIKYEFSPNTILLSAEKDYKVQNYKAFESDTLKSEGVMFFTKGGNFFYTMLFINKNIDTKKSDDLTSKIFKSIKIKNGL